ncbi:cytochrome P450 [Pseudovirgaria hyperparasitica]|uniref:Cytochrome P450 n=1 Tax=Pseudovirgaria hyperparasitica TaxID=470096 RepID=A0A6A6WAI5_9PEZI|nr:cytochrome P450 [Pseudovirgaria hyperparasitica]KAF2759872.1 cytochrome P450 [Pseudovirgaria hyperparasitica]
MASNSFLAIVSLILSVGITRYNSQTTFRWSTLWVFLVTYALLSGSRWLYRVVIYPLFLSPLRNLPSPPGAHPLMGHALQLLPHPLGLPFIKWMESIPNDGLLYYKMAWNTPRIMTTSVKAASEVQTTKSYDFIRPQNSRDFLAPILGIGVLLAEGEEHKRQRKALMPAFHYRHIKDLYPVFWEHSKRMADAMAIDMKESQSKVLVSDWVTRATLDIIGAAGFGQSFNAIDEPQGELHQVYKNVFSPKPMSVQLHHIRQFIPTNLLRMLPMKRNTDTAAAIRVIRRTARNIIRSKQIKLGDKEQPGNDIISVALDSGGFSEEDLVNQLMTFLAAGHETTATAMMFATWLLCRHPNVQQRLRDEIREKIPSSLLQDTSKATATVFDNMPYLNAVCNEVLRIYPPVPFAMRETTKDTTIAGSFIPKGVVIILPIWAFNQNKELWGQDAGDFNPDRWMAAGQANSGGAESNYASMTFLHGPRSCIGQAFAKAEFQCLLASLVGRFDMLPVPGDDTLQIIAELTNKPKGGTWALLTELKGW